MTRIRSSDVNPAPVAAVRTKGWLPWYIQLCATVGVLVIVESLFELRAAPHPYEWLLFAGLAVLAGSFSMKIGSVSASITVSDTFFITTALLFGPAPATLAAALSSFVASSRRRHAWDRVAFNTAATSLGMWAGSHVFFWIGGIPPLTQAQVPAAQLIMPLLCLTSVYFLLNTGLLAIAIGLDLGKSPVAIWRQHFSWLSVTFFGAASLSLCLALLIYEVSLGAVVVVLPLLVVLHLTLRSSFGRLEDARTHLTHLDRLYLSTVETLAMAIDAKDDVTHSHVRRVQAYAVGLAKILGVEDEATLKAIEAAALLHDTGKLAVPEHILNKPGKLSPAEFEQMKRHVDVGADILSLVDFPYPVVPIVRCHHESWDGSGYPRGVRGTDIPIGARILSVVDCFDALTSDRPYRSALPKEEAFEILRARSGTMYEPLVVDTFIRVHRDLVGGIVATPAHREVLQQISQSVVASTPQHPAPVMGPAAASDDVLAFVSLARLASGDATVTDVLALASNLMVDIAPDVTIAWYLADEGSQHLVLVHAAGPAAQELRGTTIAIGEGLSGWVAAHRQSIVNSEAALDLGMRASTINPRLESSLSAPLITGESLVGTLTLYSSAPAAFTEDQGRLVQIIAPHIAQAIRTAGRAKAIADTPTAASTRPHLSAGHELRLVATR
jgi:putative nucleotidyltransferase with HDIG domain